VATPKALGVALFNRRSQTAVTVSAREFNYMHSSAKNVHKEKRKTIDPKNGTDPIEAAEEAGLRYVSDTQPGYTRRAKNGESFEYFDMDRKPIRDEQRLLRIRRLAIPPAWCEVWICRSPNGHIQATGRDARRRKQYRYHDRWREMRDANKYERLASFGKALPKIEKRVRKDLALAGLPREKVLATVVQLLEQSLIRVGNEEYARENKSFGLTTMQDRHVDVKGSKMRFRFRGKSGRQHEIDITDCRMAKIVSKLQELPGQDLFQYVNGEGAVHDITSQDVNEYLREITGEGFTAKDFRTWAGTVLAAIALSTAGAFATKRQAKANVKNAIEAVAKILGNTPAVCRECYIHPAVVEAYFKGNSINDFKAKIEEDERGIDLVSAQVAVLELLQNDASTKKAS